LDYQIADAVTQQGHVRSGKAHVHNQCAATHFQIYMCVTLLVQTVCVHPTQEPARQYITVMQPSEGSFAVAIAVDCTGGGPFTPPPH